MITINPPSLNVTRGYYGFNKAWGIKTARNWLLSLSHASFIALIFLVALTLHITLMCSAAIVLITMATATIQSLIHQQKTGVALQ